MHRLAILAIVVGVAVGSVGGLIAEEPWIATGSVIVAAGVATLYCLALFKNPIEAVKTEAEVDAMANGYPKPNGQQTPPSAPYASSLQLEPVSGPQEKNESTSTNR